MIGDPSTAARRTARSTALLVMSTLTHTSHWPDGPAGPSGPRCSIFPRQVSAWTFSAAIALKSQRHAMGRDSRKEAPNGSMVADHRSSPDSSSMAVGRRRWRDLAGPGPRLGSLHPDGDGGVQRRRTIRAAPGRDHPAGHARASQPGAGSGSRGHRVRGVETSAFRPGRKRRFTSPEMRVLFASMFACPGTGCSPRPPSRLALNAAVQRVTALRTDLR